MFTKSLKQIFTKQALSNSFEEISSNSSGIDEISYLEFKKDFNNNIEKIIKELNSNLYTPEPLKTINIKKEHSNTFRPIALSSIKDKLVQKVLYKELNPYFDDVFLSNSYAYRTNKSPLKAINRTTNFINQEKEWILKTDIKDFFENINHNKLLEILKKHIQDKYIINLISLFLKTGGFLKNDFYEHKIGVHQGDIISPLLSNVYLDLMEKFIHKNSIDFVRYADDFVLFFTNKEEATNFKSELEKFLILLDLKLNEEKTKIINIQEGFKFLGVTFINKNKFIDNEKLQKIISKFHSIGKQKLDFIEYVEEINNYLFNLKNYYLKIIQNNPSQLSLLKENFINALSNKIYEQKINKKINSKKDFKIYLEKIKFDILFSINDTKKEIDTAISNGYEKYMQQKNYLNLNQQINKKRNFYANKLANDTILFINQIGLYLGISKNKITLKKYGKIHEEFPISKISRIIIDTNFISISSAIIQRCAKEKIHIDFIDKNYNPYATLLTYNSSSTQMIHKQAMLVNTQKGLYLAKQFIYSKLKNQVNYLKYLNKYHKNLEKHIKDLEKIINQKIKKAKTTDELLGFEGIGASIYWDGIKNILDTPFQNRITFGAKDIVNSSLNYAYAILYSKVQQCLYTAGLSLHISFLHSLNNTKPTLVFDVIEQFRTFMVDRVIISMLNKDEPIKLNKEGLLTESSRKLIAKNIKEKLGSYTMWKKCSHKCDNIILSQSYQLAKFINEEIDDYKPFIGKF